MLKQDILDDLDQLQQSSSQSQSVEQPAKLTSQLLNNPQFCRHMQTVEVQIDAKLQKKCLSVIPYQYDLILKSSSYAAKIDHQINGLYRHVKSIYSSCFPQLSSIVTVPTTYCKVVGDMEAGREETAFYYLSPHQRISLQIALSSPHEMAHGTAQVETVRVLAGHKELLLAYLESCMQDVAPALSQLVGSQTASKLISLAGGLDRLASMPACNIQVMGGHRSADLGFGLIQRNHGGVFCEIEMVRDAPRKHQMQLIRMLANNCAKCARADYLKSNFDAHKLKLEMYARFEKIQQTIMREDKPFAVPGEQPKKKRGGKRYRKTKELYEMSQVMKNKNRLKFGTEEEEEVEGVGLGMIKNNKINVQTNKRKLKVSRKMQVRMEKKSGLESSLNISTGIELINPLLLKAEKKIESGKDTYFSKDLGFKTVLDKKFGLNK